MDEVQSVQTYRVQTRRSGAVEITNPQIGGHASTRFVREQTQQLRSTIDSLLISIAYNVNNVDPTMAFLTPTLPTTTRFANRASACPTMTVKVLVSGAAGRTGRLVFEKLRSSPDFEAEGLVRDKSKAVEFFGSDEGLVEGDILNLETLKPALDGKDALVVLTSAAPKKIEASPDALPGPPTFTFADRGTPEEVDWVGARNQIDVAKSRGISQIVFVGSMGSTDENHPLNRVGNGNILRFKRKAEMYLIQSGVPYTIVNPAGLTNDDAGTRELVVGRNDELFSLFGPTGCTIPRGDVARVVVAALTSPDAKNKAMDLVARPSGDGSATADPSPLFAQTGPDL